MSKRYKPREVSLSNKFHMIAEPMDVSQIDYFGVDENNYDWLAKSRRMQARRWHKIKNEIA